MPAEIELIYFVKLDVQRALEQDATIYDYDGVYDDMKQSKADQAEENKVQDRKPKYMKTLLETAKKRQQLHERRTERKVQKEREAEGDEFADKGNFSYIKIGFIFRTAEYGLFQKI